MALNSDQRRQFVASSHPLKPVATLVAGRVTDAVVAQVRQCFTGRALLKVRVHAECAAACDEVARDLAGRVPCEVVRRIGRVVLLYRPEE